MAQAPEVVVERQHFGDQCGPDVKGRQQAGVLDFAGGGGDQRLALESGQGPRVRQQAGHEQVVEIRARADDWQSHADTQTGLQRAPKLLTGGACRDQDEGVGTSRQTSDDLNQVGAKAGKVGRANQAGAARCDHGAEGGAIAVARSARARSYRSSAPAAADDARWATSMVWPEVAAERRRIAVSANSQALRISW